MPKQVIDPEKLVSQAYAIASRDGISALSVRKVATACGIAVGSVYGYFPTKADLTAAVLTRFFDENLSDELCAVRPGERFTSYVRRFREALCRYVLRAVFASLMDGGECETLFALLDAALYDGTADEKEIK